MASTDANVTSVATSTASAQLLPANGGRAKEPGAPSVVIANDSASQLYILMGTGTASSTNYSYVIDAKTTVPGTLTVSGYCGALQGVLASGTGNARVTEYV